MLQICLQVVSIPIESAICWIPVYVVYIKGNDQSKVTVLTTHQRPLQ
jgi:hypothetical protein